MKLGVSSYSFSKHIAATKCGYEAICDIAKEIGFEGIEFINLKNEKWGETDDEFSIAAKLREHCEKIGLEIIAYTQCHYTHEEKTRLCFVRRFIEYMNSEPKLYYNTAKRKIEKTDKEKSDNTYFRSKEDRKREVKRKNDIKALETKIEEAENMAVEMWNTRTTDEKQIPKKLRIDDEHWLCCRNCDETFYLHNKFDKRNNFCGKCGQAIDRSESNDKR